MVDLTLEEKASYAAARAREQEAEKHFYDAAQPFFPLGFSVINRNTGHWDVYANQVPGKDDAYLTARGKGSSINGRTIDDVDPQRPSIDRERAFRIRGEPGKVLVADERWNPHRERGGPWIEFRSVTGAMLWIIEELMQEPTHG